MKFSRLLGNRALWLGCLILVIAVVAACGAPKTQETEQADGGAPGETGTFYGSTRDSDYTESVSSDEGQGKMASVTFSSVAHASEVVQRQVIHNAELNIEVEDLDTAVVSVETQLASLGGYISESTRSSHGESRQSAHLRLRLPAEGFEEAKGLFQELGIVTNEHSWTNDVTEEYIDLTARITNLEAQEARLRQLIERAETVEEIMQVERELTRVRQEIDSRQGRLRYLKDQVAYSTIILNLSETKLASPTITATGLAGLWQRGVAAFVRSANHMIELTADAVVLIFAAIPLLLWLTVVAAVLWIVYRQLRHRRGSSSVSSRGSSSSVSSDE